MTETDKDDLVARLRQFQADEPGFPPLFSRAAAEIERLRLQLAKARKALKEIESFPYIGAKAESQMVLIARAALADDIGKTNDSCLSG